MWPGQKKIILFYIRVFKFNKKGKENKKDSNILRKI